MIPSPKCVLVTGRPGSGKTTLSKQLCSLLHMPMLSRDEIKEGFVSSAGVSHEHLPADTNRKVTSLFFSAIEMFLNANVSIVAEAAFQHELWAEIVPRLSGIGRVCFVICEADPDLCAKRHLDRGLDDPKREFYHGDKRVKVFRETGKLLGPENYDPPSFEVPTIGVSTTDGYVPDLHVIRDFIVEETA